MLVPALLFLLKDALGRSIKATLTIAFLDFVTQRNRDWQYYAGILAGQTVAAVGSPGSAMIFYATGQALNLSYLKSEDGGGFEVFLDGVAVSTVDNFVEGAINEGWFNIEVDLDNRRRAVEIRNTTTPGAGGGMFMALAGIGVIASSVPGVISGIEQRDVFDEAPPWQVSMTFEDANGKTAKAAYYLPYFATMENVQWFCDEFAARYTAIGGGRIANVSVSYPLRVATAPARPEADREEKMSYVCAVAGEFGVAQRLGQTTITIPMWRKDKTILRRNTKKPQRRPDLSAEAIAFEAFMIEPDNAAVAMSDKRGRTVRSIYKSQYRWKSS